jgi:hypothetical protein
MKPKSDEQTLAQLFFKDKKLINERPESMTKEEYKLIRSMQSKLIKSLFKSKPGRI